MEGTYVHNSAIQQFSAIIYYLYYVIYTWLYLHIHVLTLLHGCSTIACYMHIPRSWLYSPQHSTYYAQNLACEKKAGLQ